MPASANTKEAQANYDRLKKQHDSYVELKTRFRDWLDAYEGTGGFRDGTKLTRYHDREEDEDYNDRKNNAFYLNYTKRIVRGLINSVLKVPIQRDVKNGKGFISRNRLARLRRFEHNRARPTTKQPFRTESWDHFLKKKCCKDGGVFGHANILLWNTDSEDIAMGFVPKSFAIRISPLNLWNWEKYGDEYERLVWVEPREPENKPIEKGGAQRYVATSGLYHIWELTRTSLRKFDEGGNEIGEPIPNPIGEIPFVRLIFEDSEVFPDMGQSMVGALYSVQQRLFNLDSEISKVERMQGFSQLVLEGDADRDGIAEFDEDAVATGRRMLETGPSMAMMIPPMTGIPPFFLSPDPQQLMVLTEREKKLIGEMFRIMSIDGGIAQQAREVVGAASKAFDFEDTDTLLNDIMDAVIEFDNKCQYYRSRLEGDPDGWTGSCTHPRTFGISSLQEDLVDIQLMQQSRLPNELIRHKVMLMMNRHFPNLPDEIKKQWSVVIQSTNLQLPEPETQPPTAAQ